MQKKIKKKVTNGVSKILEKDIQRAIIDYLNTIPDCVFWRNFVGPIIHGRGSRTSFSKNPMSGLPDIMGYLPNNRPFAIEVKTKTGRLSVNQKIWIEKLESREVLVFVARSVEDVIIKLEGSSE